MKSIVISYGGSVILSDDVDIIFFQRLYTIFNKFLENYKIYVVIGGGKAARTYIKLGRTLNFDEKFLDEIGIEITRINAKIFASFSDLTNKEIPKTTDEAKEMLHKIVVMGGTTPGHSTDMVAAELAEKTNAEKVIIATNVDGIFDRDPNKFKDAKQIKSISVKKLIKQYGTKWDTAGKNVVIDGPALEIIDKAQITTFVLNGKKTDQLELIFNNQKFNGTKVIK